VGILPTNNFQVGQFEHANAIGGPTIASTVLRRNKGRYSCPIGCARVTEIKPGGKYSGHGEGPEYETIFGLGSDCGVGDLDAVLYANYLCNLYAVDTISAGGTVATAMELNERGYIPQEDLVEVGTELKFGNADAVMRCLEMMSYPDGKFSRLLAEGGYRLAEHYGHPELFMGSKKQDFAAYDARGGALRRRRRHGLEERQGDRRPRHRRCTVRRSTYLRRARLSGDEGHQRLAHDLVRPPRPRHRFDRRLH